MIDVFMGRKFNPCTHCYEAPGKTPIPAEHVSFPMNVGTYVWIQRKYGL